MHGEADDKAFCVRAETATLREHGVEGVLVCDNGATGLKAETQRSRRSNTEARKAEGKRLLALMDKLPKKDYARRKELRKKAEEQFQGCVSITKDMVDAVVKEADKYGFRSIFAPFEADAQLAFLACSGQCAGVVTEDSDLVVYSVVSGISFPLILKMDSVGRAEVLDFDLRRLRQGRDAAESDDDDGGGGGGAQPLRVLVATRRRHFSPTQSSHSLPSRFGATHASGVGLRSSAHVRANVRTGRLRLSDSLPGGVLKRPKSTLYNTVKSPLTCG